MADTGDNISPTFKDYFEYSAFFLGSGFLRVMPLFISAKLGKFFAKVFCVASGRSSKFIKYQMKECFGEKYSDKEYDVLVDRFYTHFGNLCAEAVRIKTLNIDNIDNIVSWGDTADVINNMVEESGKGLFLATGHIGNWEFTGAASALKGFLAGSIARPLDNPLLNKLIKDVRESSGQVIWDKDGAIIKLLQAIKRKKSVGVLIDQDAGEQGLKVPFLGRSASTNTAVSEMAIRLKVPILPCAIVRDGLKPMKFKVMLGAPVIPESKDNSQEEVYKITEKVNNELSKIILENPEQWLWIHKRWKTPNPSDGRRYTR